MTDTLTIDTAAISAWRSNSDYDYERELTRSGETVWDRLSEWINNALKEIFGNSSPNGFDWNTVFIIAGIVLLIALIAFIIIRKPKLFYRNRKTKTDYAVTGDTIYGIDFDTEIDKAVARSDWREAVRLTYLKLLRSLSDNKLIDWQIFKTPTQYTNEFRNDRFRQLTNIFLRIRYGGIEATEDDYTTVKSLAGSVMKSTDGNLVNTQQDADNGQKGGES